MVQQEARIGGAKLWYDRAKGRFCLLVSLTIPPDPPPERLSDVVGVDVISPRCPHNHTQFYSGKQVRAKANHYARLQTRLQRKGTRSATRRRIARGNRERRFKLSTNYAIAKHLLDTQLNSLIGLEELTSLCEHIKRRKKRRKGKHLVPVSAKAHRANQHASRLAFAELRGLLTYKAALSGSCCISVDADYTSQCSPCCGYTNRQNRPNHGLMFVRQHCGYSLHADLVGARNIALRTLVIRQDWMAKGQLARALDVTDNEAKAARLQKYAELRWSSATSLMRKPEVLDISQNTENISQLTSPPNHELKPAEGVAE